MRYRLSQRLVPEFLGTALLVGAVVGSGVMGERLANGNAAIALLTNRIATGTILFCLIATFGLCKGWSTGSSWRSRRPAAFTAVTRGARPAPQRQQHRAQPRVRRHQAGMRCAYNRLRAGLQPSSYDAHLTSGSRLEACRTSRRGSWDRQGDTPSGGGRGRDEPE